MALFIYICQKKVLIYGILILFILAIIGSSLIGLPVVQFHVTVQDRQPLQLFDRLKKCLEM